MRIVNLFLCIQLFAGIFSIIKDIQFRFQTLIRVDELVKEIPSNNIITTDYWALNTFSAYEDKAFYCIDLQKKLSFLVWKDDQFKVLKDSSRYYNGVNHFMQKENINQLYFISINSPHNLNCIDSLLFEKYKVELLDKREGAIEKGSNLYLYKISQ